MTVTNENSYFLLGAINPFLFSLLTGVSSVVLQKQIKDLHQEQKVLRDTGLIPEYILLPLLRVWMGFNRRLRIGQQHLNCQLRNHATTSPSFA